MARQHGITTSTTGNLIFDAGAVYVNYGESGEALLGATRGGSTFAIETDYREMEFDGAKGPIKGGRRIVGVRAKMTVNLIEFSKENFLRALSGADAADETTYWEITRSASIAAADYLTNIALLAETSASDTVPVACILKNALADGNLELAFADDEETGLTIEFTAHQDVSDLDTEPWEIRYPQ